MVATVTCAHGDGLVPDPSLSAGERLRRAGTAPMGSPFRDGWKLGEPHDRQQGETDLHGRRGKSVEVVRNHAGGTRERLAVSPRREPWRHEFLGVGLSGSVRWRGDLWTTPRETVRPAGRTVWNRDATGKSASRSGGTRAYAFACHAARSKGPRGSRCSTPAQPGRVGHRRSWRGAAKPSAAESTGYLPPWKAPVGRSERRVIVRSAQAQPPVEEVWFATPMAPRCGEVSGEIRSAPEDQTNHIPARLCATRLLRKGGSGAAGLEAHLRVCPKPNPCVHL
jgi:hypothetical protein